MLSAAVITFAIVADAELDEEVTVEIDTVQSNVAFASIIERRE